MIQVVAVDCGTWNVPDSGDWLTDDVANCLALGIAKYLEEEKNTRVSGGLLYVFVGRKKERKRGMVRLCLVCRRGLTGI